MADSEKSDVLFSSRAYSKMLLHAVKYPHCSVNGLLLAPSASSQAAAAADGLPVVTDCVPLFHQAPGLSPMIEVALAQVESACNSSSRRICGFYHANENFRDCNVDVFSQRVADKIADNSSSGKGSGGGGPVLLATIDNKRLGLAMDAHALVVSQNVDGKWRSKERGSIRLEEGTLETVSAAIQSRLQDELADFDNHLDNLQSDYLNAKLNERLDQD